MGRGDKNEYGEKLVDLHLLKSSVFDSPVAKLQSKGDNKIEKLNYNEKEKRVYFNQNQYFEGISNLKKTIEVQKAIDNVYPEVEKEILSL